MDFFQLSNHIPLFIFIGITFCQSCTGTTPVIPENGYSYEISKDRYSQQDFCDYFYSKDSLNDTLHFNFGEREDFGPVYLSDDDLRQIYSEIKRGNIDAYKLLLNHYFYTYSYKIPDAEIDKLICITDFLAHKYSYHTAYLLSGNIIFDNLTAKTDDYYISTLIKYYETYFNISHSKSIAIKLHYIFCGNYSFHKKDSVKAEYYEGFIKNCN